MFDKDWFSVFLIRFLLATSGIKLKNDKLRYLSHPALVVMLNLLSVSLCTISLYLRENDTNVEWIIVNNLVHVANYFATWVIIYRNRDTFIKIADKLKINVYKYPPEMLKFKPEENSSRLATFILFIMIYTSYFGILLLPAVREVMNESPPSKDGLMYPCWFPWTIDTPTKYLLTYLIQLVGGTFACWFMPVNILFVIHFVFIIQEQRDILYAVFRNVKAHDAAKTVPDSSQCRTSEFQRNLMECMKHHSAIIR